MLSTLARLLMAMVDAVDPNVVYGERVAEHISWL
jgi:hypothetical protein